MTEDEITPEEEAACDNFCDLVDRIKAVLADWDNGSQVISALVIALTDAMLARYRPQVEADDETFMQLKLDNFLVPLLRYSIGGACKGRKADLKKVN